MSVNLAVSYGTKPSPPRSQSVLFYAPSQPDYLFGQGDTVTIECQSVERGLSLTWGLCRNTVRAPFLTGKAESRVDNSFAIEIPTAGLAPGFHDLRVAVATTKTTPLTGVTTFGWRVMDEPLATVRPNDFHSFWRSATL